MPDRELSKCRDIVILADTDAAAALLGRLPGVSAQAFPDQQRVTIRYEVDLHQYQQLRALLLQCGFPLEDSHYARMRDALIDYSESVQLHNLGVPATALKSREAYMHVYEQHMHGDHDATPEELRHEL